MVIMAAFDNSLLNENKAQQCELSVNDDHRFFQANTSLEFDKYSFNNSAQYLVSCGICPGGYHINYIIPMATLMNVNSCSVLGTYVCFGCAQYVL